MAIAALVVSSSACQGGWTEIISSGLYDWSAVPNTYMHGVTDTVNGHSYFVQSIELDTQDTIYRTDGSTAAQVTEYLSPKRFRTLDISVVDGELVASIMGVGSNEAGHFYSTLPVDPTTPGWTLRDWTSGANHAEGGMVYAPDLPGADQYMISFGTSFPRIYAFAHSTMGDASPISKQVGSPTVGGIPSYAHGLCKVDEDYIAGYWYKNTTTTGFWGMDPSAWSTLAYDITWAHGINALPATDCIGWDASNLSIHVQSVSATPTVRIAIIDASGNFDVQQTEGTDLRTGVIWDNGAGELAYLIDSDTGELWTSDGVDDFAVVSGSATDSGVEHDALVLCPHADALCVLGSDGSLWMWTAGGVTLPYQDTSIWSSIKSSVR